jgi:hypothetical protein
MIAIGSRRIPVQALGGLTWQSSVPVARVPLPDPLWENGGHVALWLFPE